MEWYNADLCSQRDLYLRVGERYIQGKDKGEIVNQYEI